MNIYWFRKCLRVHDNEGLLRLSKERNLLPLFILDDYYFKHCDIHPNRL